MNSSNFRVESLGFLHKLSCHLWKLRVWLLCWFGCLLFLFVAWLPRLGLPVLCWAAVTIVDISVMFLTLREKLSVFPHWEWHLLCVFVYDFYDIEVCSLCPYVAESFYQERMLCFFKCFFCFYREDHMNRVLSFINAVYHWLICVCWTILKAQE